MTDSNISMEIACSLWPTDGTPLALLAKDFSISTRDVTQHLRALQRRGFGVDVYNCPIDRCRKAYIVQVDRHRLARECEEYWHRVHDTIGDAA